MKTFLCRNGWLGNMLEHAPQVMWSAVYNPLVLDFMERVVGSFGQLDNLTLAPFTSQAKDDPEAKKCAWRRDRW